MEVVEKSSLEAHIVGITSDGGGDLWVCMESLESKYTNDSIFTTQAPIDHVVPFTYIARCFQGRSAIDQVGQWWGWHRIDEAEYSEVHNMDKEYPEGGSGSPGGTD